MRQIEAIALNDYVVKHTFDHFTATGQYGREIGAFLFNWWYEKSANKAGINVNQLINSEKCDTVGGNTMIHDFYNIMSG